MQADALVIEARAQCRLADAYDAAQAADEVAGHGGTRGNQYAKVIDENLGKPTLADIGPTKGEIHEAGRVVHSEIPPYFTFSM
jgi:hypothetical protein